MCTNTSHGQVQQNEHMSWWIQCFRFWEVDKQFHEFRMIATSSISPPVKDRAFTIIPKHCCILIPYSRFLPPRSAPTICTNAVSSASSGHDVWNGWKSRALFSRLWCVFCVTWICHRILSLSFVLSSGSGDTSRRFSLDTFAVQHKPTHAITRKSNRDVRMCLTLAVHELHVSTLVNLTSSKALSRYRLDISYQTRSFVKN